MKRKVVSLFILLVSLFTISGCAKSDSIIFKEDYEKLNHTTNSVGKEHRTVNIDKNNPFVEVSAEDIVNKIENKETFYVYFGSTLCPWCRSSIEKAIEVANKKDIKTIYYVDIWDDEGKEILRDKYTLEDNKLVKTIDGTDAYKKLLEYFDELLDEYTLTDENEKEISTKEKRIYAPNYIYVSNGTPTKLVEGISDKQKDSREELTEEILKDEEDIFNEFFNN